jgi:hypothetical protein
VSKNSKKSKTDEIDVEVEAKAGKVKMFSNIFISQKAL